MVEHPRESEEVPMTNTPNTVSSEEGEGGELLDFEVEISRDHDYEMEIGADGAVGRPSDRRTRTQRAMRRTLDGIEQDLGLGLSSHKLTGFHSSDGDGRSIASSILTSDSQLLAAPFPWGATEGGQYEDGVERSSATVASGAHTGVPASLRMTPGLSAPQKSVFRPTHVYDPESEELSLVVSRSVIDEECEERVGIWDGLWKKNFSPNDTRKYRGSRVPKIGLCFIFVLVIIAFVAIGPLLFGSKEKAEEVTSPTMSPTSMEDAAFLKEFSMMVGKAVYEHATPQQRAANWIMKEDPMKLGPYSPKLLERYMLTVFYFVANFNGYKHWRSCAAAMEDNGSDCAFDRLVRNSDDSLSYKPEVSTRWLSGVSVCDWAGIVCHNEEVIEIDLAGQNITGQLPVELAGLPKLQSVSLQYNAFTGAIPDEYAEMRYLTKLGLQDNKLTGSIPEALYTMQILEDLNLDNNALTGTISTLLGQLERLKGLYLGRNKFVGKIPMEIEKLSDLTRTRWDHNSFTGNFPVTFGFLTNLEELWLHANELTGNLPRQIGNLKNLKDLQLFQNQLTSAIPEGMYGLTNLQRLELSENLFTGSLSTNVGQLVQLQDFRVRRNKLTGSIPWQLGALDKLQIIWLQQNLFSGDVPDQVCENVGHGTLEFLNADCGDASGTGGANGCLCCTGCCNRETNVCKVVASGSNRKR